MRVFDVVSWMRYVGAAVLALAFAVPVSAQRPIELGVDAGVQLVGNGTDLNQTLWRLPIGAVRLGVHLNDHVSLEGSVSATHTALDDFASTSVSSFELLSMVLYHFGEDRGSRRFHVLLGVPLRYLRAGDSSGSFSDTEIGLLVGGIGMSQPIADHLGLRFQVRGIGWEGSSTRLSFLVGFSYLSID